MSTDRSLWVEDKYALRCRTCGEKFTMFRRRHHCRRCGQVFCYECLHSAQAASASQSLVDNMYEWFAPSPTRAARHSPRNTRAGLASTDACSTPIPICTSTAVDESVQAELATRLCRRCAATILDNAERESSVSRLEYRPSSTATTATQLLSASSFSPAAPSPLSGSPGNFLTPARGTMAVSLSEPSNSPMNAVAPGSLPPCLDPLQLNQRPAGEERAKEADVAWRTARHAETAEEREVTYTTGRVRRRVPATMAEWWAVHQRTVSAEEHRRLLRADRDSGSAVYVIDTPGADTYILSDPVDFCPAFRLCSTAADLLDAQQAGEEAEYGSAACHDVADATAEEAALLARCADAVESHLLSRLDALISETLPRHRLPFLKEHLAAVAWRVVQRTTVGVGSTIMEHLSVFSVLCPALPLQCAVYPGLLCPQRLPSKRAMTACDHPRVLLLAGHLSYPVQPAEDLVDYVRSYSGYLDKLFQRLLVWSPDIIVVEGGMHHYLRGCIEQDGRMRLLLHAGRDLLVQLSWCLGADIIADLQYVSVGELATTAPMGTCARFEVLELAEDAFYCGFTGLPSIRFHTLVFRGAGMRARVGSGGANSSMAADRPSPPPFWASLEQLGLDAVAAAYHAALQSHWLMALLRASDKSALYAAIAASAVSEPASATAALTLNLGCQFPREVMAACGGGGGGGREAAGLVRDTLVLNVVHMDHLFEGGGVSASTSAGGSPTLAAAVSPASAMGTLTRARSSDFAMDAATPQSTSSTGTSRTDLANLLLAGFGGAGLTTPSLTRTSEAAAAHAYAVVQQKAALTFYGAGDDCLYTFLMARCTSAESQLLYLHGGHRVRVQISAASRWPSASVSSSARASTAVASPPAPPAAAPAALEVAQAVAFHSAAVRQKAARAIEADDDIGAATMAALLTFLRGTFSLHISVENVTVGRSSPPPAGGAAGSADVVVPVCPPHLLNVSTAALVEWLLYSWMPHLLPRSEERAGTAPLQQLRLVFTFHPAPAPAGQLAGPVWASRRDVVTLTVDPISVLQVRYPYHSFPSRPVFPKAALADLTPQDLWYTTQEADELEATVKGFYHALKAATSGAEGSEKTDSSAGETTSGGEQGGGGGSPAPTTMAALLQLCERTKGIVDVFRSAQTGGTTEVALFLRTLRQRLLPALLAGYRTWQADARKAVAAAAAAAAAAVPTTSAGMRDGDAVDLPALTTAADRGVLRAVEDCYYHAERSHWIRFGEPTSVVAAALQLLYSENASTSFPTALSSPVTAAEPPSLTRAVSEVEAMAGQQAAATDSRAAAPPLPVKPHVSFAPDSGQASIATSGRSSFRMPFALSSAAPAPTPPPKLPLAPLPPLSRPDALDVLRRCGGAADATRPVTVACALRGYRAVLPSPRPGGAAGAASPFADSGAAGVSSLGARSGTGSVNTAGSSLSSSVAGLSGDVGVTVEVLFPHAFAALHVLYTDGHPLDLAASLLRCRPYMTDGGKSQARFFVSEDGRFLMKCVKPTEMRYFREWAPGYFARMAAYYATAPSTASPPPSTDTTTSATAGADATSLPLLHEQTTLGKVLGLYVVHVHGSRCRPGIAGDSSLSSQPPPSLQQQQQQQQQHSLRNYLPDGTHCFMVGEQLLFQRPVRETWDLKGSQRNRTTEQSAAVRLDVDFVQEHLRHGDFFFCAPEAKSLLMDHLSRDTQLLAESGIMDYSLMASIGSEVEGGRPGNVYVGMIDFLHPYSSAKVLESKMKSGLDTVFGYGRQDPTIIDPASYAARFMLWMDGYFNGVPDRLFPWTRVRLLAEQKEKAAMDRQAPLSP